MTGEIREPQIRGWMKFRNLHVEKTKRPIRAERGKRPDRWEEATHQFVVVVDIVLLQGVKVAATDEGGGVRTRSHGWFLV